MPQNQTCPCPRTSGLEPLPGNPVAQNYDLISPNFLLVLGRRSPQVWVTTYHLVVPETDQVEGAGRQQQERWQARTVGGNWSLDFVELGFRALILSFGLYKDNGKEIGTTVMGWYRV